jgi:hypothetical protein
VFGLLDEFVCLWVVSVEVVFEEEELAGWGFCYEGVFEFDG